MSLFRRRRHADLDARVADAQARAETAAEEARMSAARQETIRANVVRPLRDLAEQNQFAALIRASLIEGGRRA